MWKSILILTLSTGLALFTLAVQAQTTSAEQVGKPNKNFGMDDATFKRLFGKVFTDKKPIEQASATTEEVADQVSEIRVFLTSAPNVVIGEIATAGKTRVASLDFVFEQGPVKFVDNGERPDRRRGDGVFTAQFRMDTIAVWQPLRRELATSAQVLRAAPARSFVRRGPRDIVPVREALEGLRAQMPREFAALNDAAGRMAEVANIRDPREAARLLQVDIATKPFITIPGPRIDPRIQFRVHRVFDFPILLPFPSPAPPVPIDDAKSLMVVHPGVVDDPSRTFDVCGGAAATGTAGGPWSFGHLMREMSFGTGMTPEDFTMHWLSTWVLPQEANGFIVNEPGRAAQLQATVIATWQSLSGAALNVDFFPARLLAIVNRPDLADKIGYGTAGSAGEGRLVFGLLSKPTPASPCNVLPFTVIFEYGIKGGSCSAVKAWHQLWKNLDSHTVGSASYNAALETITRAFTDHGSNPGQSPNQSSLNQLRTNEIALGPVWQLREFRLQATGTVAPGVLDLVTVKQTPDDGFRNGTVGTATVAAYIAANELDILGNRHVVPERFPTVFDPFMGAKSDIAFPPDQVFWNAPLPTVPPMTNPAEARRKFSLGTCNACHGGETNTFFTHIGTRSAGLPPALSGFLTGIDVTVPVTGGIHHYADLAERELAMSNILTNSCFGLLGVRRIPFVH